MFFANQEVDASTAVHPGKELPRPWTMIGVQLSNGCHLRKKNRSMKLKSFLALFCSIHRVDVVETLWRNRIFDGSPYWIKTVLGKLLCGGKARPATRTPCTQNSNWFPKDTTILEISLSETQVLHKLLDTASIRKCQWVLNACSRWRLNISILALLWWAKRNHI